MPRESATSTLELTERALHQFWTHGFHATSMDALVKSTGVSRHGIYAGFGGKKQLFEACFDRYQTLIVTPAFGRVEASDADLSSIAAYYESQIALAETIGLPGPGCFVANSSTEIAPHDASAKAKVAEHNARLRRGFTNALANERRNCGALSPLDLGALADVFVVFTNGLWSMSRTTTDANDLRVAVKTFLSSMEGTLR
ncbi:helix-turn-helix domain-containing protein [Planktotalea sp.]|uniref:TetR/AcrR family transcriptional regulator n=1 Tax=Planktotalea sp. TaxID=2029877 RepID=UPI003298AF16